MAYLADSLFLEEATSPIESDIFYTKSNGEEIVFDIESTATSFKVNIYGLVDKENGSYHILGAIRHKDYQNVTSITNTGIFNVDIRGIAQIKVELESVTGGSVTVFGKEVS